MAEEQATDAKTILENVRQRFPQYRNTPDDLLARGLIQRYPVYEPHLRAIAGPPQIQPEPSAYQRVIEVGAPAALGTIGAVGGQALAGTPGRIAGSGLGQAAGAAVAEASRPLLAPSMSQATLMESVKRIAKEGAIGAAAEWFVPFGLRKTGETSRKALVGVARPGQIDPAVQAARESLKAVGGDLSLGQLSGRQIALGDVIEGAAENGIFGSGGFARFRLKQEGWMRQMTDAVADQIGTRLSNENVSGLIKDVLDRKMTAFSAIQKSLYGKVDDLAGPAGGVQTQAILDYFRQNAKNKHVQDLASHVLPQGLDSLTTLRPGTVANPMAEGGYLLGQTAPSERIARIPWQDMQHIRSLVLEIERRKLGTGPLADIGAIKQAKRLSGVINDAIESSASTLPDQAKEAWRFADTVSKEGHDLLTTNTINSLYRKVRDAPSNLSRVLLTPNGTDRLKRLRDAIGPDEFEKVQHRLAQTTLERSAGLGTGLEDAGIVTGRKLRQTLASLGPEMNAMAFTPEMKDSMIRLANALEVSGSRPGGPGKIAMALSQAGAGFEVATGMTGQGPVRKAAYTILLAPMAIQHLFTSPKIVGALAEGIKAGPGSQALRTALTQLSVSAAMEREQKPPEAE